MDPQTLTVKADTSPPDFRSGSKSRGLFVGCLTSQQHESVSQGRSCSDNCTCCHTEIEGADLPLSRRTPHHQPTEAVLRVGDVMQEPQTVTENSVARVTVSDVF